MNARPSPKLLVRWLFERRGEVPGELQCVVGTLPVRAYRYCDAITSAAGFGWWVFPPSDLQLLWDGHDIFWHCDDLEEWIPLFGSAQFPHQSAHFDQAAPADLQGCSPPFLSALSDPGVVQVWTGLMVRSAPDWTLLVRAPANVPVPGGYTIYEGILEKRPPLRPPVYQHPPDPDAYAGTIDHRGAAAAGSTTSSRGL